MRIRFSLVFAALAVSVLYGQKPKDNPNDWPMYTRDLAGTRYSPLKQINAGNVSKLTAAWTFKLNSGGCASACSGRPRGAGGQRRFCG